jgi:predicted transposase YbfD/YdcC
MAPKPLASFQAHFGTIDDPRIERSKRHQLLDIITIAICAVISNADSWVEVEAWGRIKLKWLRKYLGLPNGIPSHDTFSDVFGRLKPEQFESAFLSWVQAVMQVTDGQVIAIDGKTLRRSHDRRLGKNAIHLVSAWATANHLVLGQVRVDEKSNEITAIPALLQVLELAGCIVTLDALGTQTEIAQTIVDQQADYVLALKENHGRMYEDVVATFDEADELAFAHVPHTYAKTINKGHGRLEVRECWAIDRSDYIEALRDWIKWPHLRSLVRIRAQRRVGNVTSVEDRYHMTSLPGQADHLLTIIRSHWGVENELHWSLDVTFREDDSRVRKGDGAQNFSILRRLALNLLKRENTAKIGLKAKRLKAGWDTDYLLTVLSPA